MPKRVPLDPEQFKVRLPKPKHDPLDAVIPTRAEPSSSPLSPRPPKKKPKKVRVVRGQRVGRYVRDVRSGRAKRATKRHPFDIYTDQLKTLRGLKAKSMMRGELKSMSSMVREAIDDYVEKSRNRTERTHRTARTIEVLDTKHE